MSRGLGDVYKRQGENLVEALRGHIPSNMLLYGVPGSGKTVVTKMVLKQLKSKGRSNGTSVKAYTINCRTVDTKYRVIQGLANHLERDGDVKIPFTGWPTDRVLEEFQRRMDRRGGMHVIVLDEIDHLVSKVCLLYTSPSPRDKRQSRMPSSA